MITPNLTFTSDRDGILQRAHDMIFRDEVPSCEIPKNLNVKPFLQI